MNLIKWSQNITLIGNPLLSFTKKRMGLLDMIMISDHTSFP